jgi:hypothetical protein
MNTLQLEGLVKAHELNSIYQSEVTNRIALYCPATVYDAFAKLESKLKNYSASKTSILRTVVPEWGGPSPKSGRHHVSSGAMEFLKKVPLSELGNALQIQESHFARINATSSYQRRHRHYLKSVIDACIEHGWLISNKEEEDQPKFNQFNSPVGTRRVYGYDVRTTNMQHPKTYALGKLNHHIVEVDGRQVIGNTFLEKQISELKSYIAKIRKNGETDAQNIVRLIMQILGYLHDVKGISLEEISLNSVVPFVKLKYTEHDFENHPAFERNKNGQLLDPQEAEQFLAMSEALAQRKAKQQTEVTLEVLEGFFAWRQEELALLGKPEGYEPSTKRAYLVRDNISGGVSLSERN